MFNIAVQHGRQSLLAVATGAATLDDMVGAAAMVAVIAGRAGHRRALVDVLGAQPQLTPEQHQQLGVEIARAWAALERVAVVVPASLRIGVGEQAAQQQGLRLRTFTALEPATQWLLGP